jgi:glyoxylase-like metal-dependent hydrolase (beta-lactamase superfamily II)
MLRRIFGGVQDQVNLFVWDDEVVPGVTALDAKGHTPGHTAFMIGSGVDRLLMISDVTNHPALFFTNPDWAASFDMDAHDARKTRHRVLDLAASERLRIAGYHLPFPATGYVERQGTGFRFAPAQWLYGA